MNKVAKSSYESRCGGSTVVKFIAIILVVPFEQGD